MDPFVAEIITFAGNFAPKGWALCNGQLLPIAQNTALYSLLGTNYGGDGRTTFGLPNLQGRAVIDAGSGAGLTAYTPGQAGGQTNVTLDTTNLPSHNHSMNAVGRAVDASSPTPAGGTALATGVEGGAPIYYSSGGGAAAMSNTAIGPSGGNQPHNNLQPYLALTFIIALVGIYPQRP